MLRVSVRNLKQWVLEILYIFLFLQNQQFFNYVMQQCHKICYKLWVLAPTPSKSMDAETHIALTNTNPFCP